jgi:hypothetical protein
MRLNRYHPVSLESNLFERAFVSRQLRTLRHEPRIIPAIYTKPFVKGQKNDYNDAEAVAEAALRPNLRVVQEKSQDQLDLQVCHRCPGPAPGPPAESAGPQATVADRTAELLGERSGNAYADATTDEARERSRRVFPHAATEVGCQTRAQLYPGSTNRSSSRSSRPSVSVMPLPC